MLKKDPASAVTINVSQDQDAAKDQVKSFVTAFNDLMTFAGDQTKAANSGDKNNIGRDALLRGLRNDLRGAINTKFASGGKFEYLSQIGIGFARDGSMKFDEAKFDEATKGGNGEVLKLFTGSDGVSGAFGALDTLLTSYTQAGGLLPHAEDRVDSQLTSIGVRIDAMNVRLALRRDALSKEFTATDSAISALNNSINSLSSLNNQVPTLLEPRSKWTDSSHSRCKHSAVSRFRRLGGAARTRTSRHKSTRGRRSNWS